MTTITPAELALRTRASSFVRITETDAATFVGYWLKHRIVEEPLPGRYQLTDHGRHIGAGLLAAAQDDDQDDGGTPGGTGIAENRHAPPRTPVPLRERNPHGEAGGGK